MKSITNLPFFFFTCVLFCCLPNHASALNYYWVNGSGNWSDYANHWAKIPTPAGAGDFYANVPGSADDVHFTDNAGVAYTLNIDAASTIPKCRNMDWSAVPMGTVMGGMGSRLDIYGSTMFSSNMTISFTGEVHFIAFGSMSTIASAGVHFNGNMFFEGTIGGWKLVDDFYCGGSMSHEGGLLETDNHMVTIDNGFNGFAGQLHLGSSEFKILSSNAYFRYDASQFDAGTSHIKMYACAYLEGPQYFSSPIRFYDVSFFAACTGGQGGFAWGHIDGTLTFHQYGGIHSYGNIVPELNNVIFLEGGTIYNANDYHHLTLTAGKTYTISGIYDTWGTDQTILPGGTLTALGAGTCSEFITIRSWQYGTAVRFVNNSGTNQTVHCVILEDIHAAGSNTLTDDGGVDLGNTTGWFFTNPHAMPPLYWVGGAGDWDDPCHWTDNPASLVGDCNCLPTAATDVYFTANSGFSADPMDVEYIDTPSDASYIACRDMNWTTVTGHPTFHSVYNGALTSDEYIYGSLKYSPDMIQDFHGATRFRTSSLDSILSAGQVFKEIIYFEGTGELRLLDAFSFTNGWPNYSDIYHLRGTIRTLGNSITLDVNNGWQGNKNFNNVFVDQGAELWLGEVGGNSSTVTFSGNAAFVAGYEPGKFHAVHSHIKPEGPGGATVTAENRPNDFWNVSFVNNYYGIFYGGILNKLTYDGTYGYVENSSPNRLIHEMEMKNNGEINGNQTFDIVTLTGGNGYLLQNGTVQTITSGGAFYTTSDCEHYVTLTSGYPDKTSAIKKEGGGALTISYVVLDNITADLSTGAIYSTLNGVAVGMTTGWSIVTPPARTLYWVGGDGDWNSAAHWSLASGGAGGECPPTPLDNVFFNGLSGLDASNFVTISQYYAHCKDMNWTGVGNGTKLTGFSKNLNIYGNLTFASGMSYEIYVTYFRASQPVSITSAGIKYYYVYFWNPAGEWTFLDDFETIQDVDIYHYYGTIHSNNQTIGIGRVWWTNSGSTSAKLFLGSSKMRYYPTIWAAEGLLSYGPGDFDAGTSEIIFESGVWSVLADYNNTIAFYNVTFKAHDSRISNGKVLGKLLFEKDATIYSNNVFILNGNRICANAIG
jgi:hypothetical protein